MQNPIQRIYVRRWANGTAQVHWELIPYTKLPDSARFTLYWSRDPNLTWPTAWSVIGSPVGPDVALVDTLPRSLTVDDAVWYRLRLVMSQTFDSQPCLATNGLDLGRYRLYRELIRKEVLHATHNPSGAEGLLRRRRWWGTLCTQCLDQDSEAITDERCPVCYGTRYVGGYWPSWSTRLIWSPQKRELGTSQIGPDEVIIRQARIPAVSEIGTGDIWIDQRNNQRWAVHAIDDAAMIQETPVVYMARMALLRPTNVAYTLPG